MGARVNRSKEKGADLHLPPLFSTSRSAGLNTRAYFLRLSTTSLPSLNTTFVFSIS